MRKQAHELFSQVIDGLLDECSFLLLEHSPALIQAYLTYRGSEEHVLKVWQALLAAVAQQPQKGLVLMKPIIDAARNGRLPSYLKSKDGELDDLVLKWVDGIMEGSLTAGDLPLLEQILRIGGELSIHSSKK